MRYIFSFIFLGFTLSLTAQKPTQWDLRTCVEYAIKHNISVQQADIQARLAKLQADQARDSRLPNLTGSSGLGMRLGRSIDPVTNAFTTTQFLFNNFGLNGGVQVYNNNRLSNTAAASNYSWLASIADLQTASNDISVNVATFYLAVLSSKQQLEITQTQISSTAAQLSNTRKRVDAGALPELNAAELEARLATDSSNYFSALSSFQQNVLNLKALLNLDMAEPFEVETPALDKIPLEKIADLEPAALYKLALTNQPLQKVNDFRYKSAEFAIKAAKAGMYPYFIGWRFG